MYSLVIWDFNGTILDDVAIGIKTVNKLLCSRGLKTLSSIDEYHKVFGFPIIEYYKKLGFDFDKESYELLAKEWVKEYTALENEATLRPFVKELLEKINALGVSQVILSASEKTMLTRQVEFLGISGHFEEILGMEDIYAYGKEEMAKRWMAKRGIEKALLIGDTEHDASVARALGADCILICGGHQGKETLEKCGAFVTDEKDAVDFVASFIASRG